MIRFINIVYILIALSAIIKAQDKIYWSEYSSRRIVKSNIDGTNVEVVINTLSSHPPLGIVLDPIGEKIYWGTGERIKRANLDGSNKEDFITGLLSPYDVKLDIHNGKIYFVDEATGKIQRANLSDGSFVEDLAVGIPSPTTLALDLVNKKMYWGEVDPLSLNGLIKRADLDGSNIDTLFTIYDHATIAIDEIQSKLYWANGNKIYKGDLHDLSSAELIDLGVSQPRGIMLNLKLGKLYWLQDNPSLLMRANLDGSGIETLLSSGLVGPHKLALQSSPYATLVPKEKAVVPGQSFTVDITVGSSLLPIENLLGIGFQVNYDTTDLRVLSINTGSFLDTGDPNDIIFFSQNDTLLGNLGITVSRVGGLSGVDGNGIIASLQLQIKSTTADSTFLSINEIYAIDSLGNKKQVIGIGNTIAIDSLVMYPGDANANGVVDGADVLTIGIFYGDTGPPRLDSSYIWAPYYAIPWENIPATFADGISDGQINQNDVIPVALNFGKTVGLQKYSTENAIDVLQLEQLFNGRMICIDISLGDENNVFKDVLGASLRVNFPNDYFFVDSVKAGSFLENENLLRFVRHDKELESLSIVFTRKKNNAAAQGFGSIAKLFLTSLRDSPGVIEIELLDAELSMSGIIHQINEGLYLNIAEETVVDIDKTKLPDEIMLESNYPNPFNANTIISYRLPVTLNVYMSIFNVLGEEVYLLIDEVKSKGSHKVIFNGSNLSSGLYFLNFKAGSFVKSLKMLLIK